MSSRVSFDDNSLNDSGNSTPKLSAPIDIPSAKQDGQVDDHPARRRRGSRRRAPSEASSYSSQSGDSPPPTTPPGARSSDEGTSPADIATSPILSYFLAHASPVKSTATFSFKNRRKSLSGAPALFQDEEDNPELPHVLHHARRVSASWATSGTIGIPQKGPITDSQQERNTSIMRRLSLGGGSKSKPAFSSPTNATRPSQSAIAPPAPIDIHSVSPRRSATITGSTLTHRPPSPMGERMLKGHFDGF